MSRDRAGVKPYLLSSVWHFPEQQSAHAGAAWAPDRPVGEAHAQCRALRDKQMTQNLVWSSGTGRDPPPPMAHVADIPGIQQTPGPNPEGPVMTHLLVELLRVLW